MIYSNEEAPGSKERIGFFSADGSTPTLTMPRSAYGNHVVFSAPSSPMADANYNNNEFSFYVNTEGQLKGMSKDNLIRISFFGKIQRKPLCIIIKDWFEKKGLLKIE